MKTKSILSICLVLAVCLIAAPPAPKKFSSFDAQVKPIVAGMTLDEKIGQMTQPDQSYIRDPGEIETLAFGSILSGGTSDPKEGNSLQAWTDLYERLQQHTQKTRLKIPLLYGIDSVHGHNNVLGAVIFPHNIGLGCTRNPQLVEKIQHITAEEMRATGIQWAFAPCVTVPQDARWGRTYEGFSEDPAVVRELGAAAVRGFQGLDLANPLSVLACSKHFIGDGGTAFGSAGRGGSGLDQGDTRVDEAMLRDIHLQGYISTVKAGVGTIMPSYSSWNGEKVSGNKHLLTDILKNELGFEGFLISDYNAVDQVDRDFKTAIAKSINAGMDMVMEPQRYKLYMDNLKALVNEGAVPMARIDDAVTRILRVKFAMGMMDPKRSQMADRKLQKTFGSPQHRAVARQAVRESLVLLKNQNRVLPLSKSAVRIHVAGKSADDIGNQSGGWTIDWQGKSGAVTTGGTTLLAAIKKAAPKAKVTFSVDGSDAKGATVGVVAIGERPYAEGAGDRANLALAPEDVTAIDNMKAAGIPVVAILFSGRPVILGDSLDKVDGFIAAWLPGSEGDGIADVLFGDFKPKGKLSFAWPRSMDQFPRTKNTNPLFAFGYGLSW